jgi:hypothetical protein
MQSTEGDVHLGKRGLFGSVIVILTPVINQFVAEHYRRKCDVKDSHTNCSAWRCRTVIIERKYKPRYDTHST